MCVICFTGCYQGTLQRLGKDGKTPLILHNTMRFPIDYRICFTA